MIRSFFKDSIIYTIPALVSRGLALFLVPLYTRVLSPDDFGALDLFMVFAGIVNLTIALEVSQAVARFYPEESDTDKKIGYASSAFWFTLGCYLSFSILAFFFAAPASRLVMGSSGLEDIFRIGLLHILFNGILYLMQNQLRWELRSKAFALLSLVYTLVTTGLSVWLAYGLNMGLAGLMWGMAGGACAAVLLGSWQLQKTFRWQFSKQLLSSMLRFSAPLVPASIAVWVSSYVDRMMINHFLSLEEVGLYGIGFRLAGIVSLVMVGFQMALTPLIYTHHEKPETPGELARIFRLFLAFCLLFFAGMNLFAHDLLVLFTQPAYYDANKVIVFLVPSIMLSQMYIFAPGINIAKKTNYVVWINVAGASINALLNWIFIPLMGYTGAALATMLAQGMVFGTYMYFSQHFFPVPHHWVRIIVASLWVVVLVLFSKYNAMEGYFHWLNGLAILVLSIIGFRLSGLIKPAEWQYLQAKILNRFN
jgi:O-antigen/teichoic acid export membrane protein